MPQLDRTEIITLVLGISALIIATTTLVFAYSIRKNDNETKKKSILDKKNAFERSLRDFFVQLMWSKRTDPQIIERSKRMEHEVSMLQPFFGNLRITFNNHDLTDYETSNSLSKIEMGLNSIKGAEIIAHSIYLKYIEEIEDRLNAIATKYNFESLET